MIDSKHFEAQINFDSIEEMEETDDEKICLTYMGPSETPGSGL